MTQVHAMAATRRGSIPRYWLQWTFFMAFLLLAVESVLIAIVFKDTLLVLLAPGGVCLLKSRDLWQDVRGRLKP